jgi:hypothetical protein
VLSSRNSGNPLVGSVMAGILAPVTASRTKFECREETKIDGQPIRPPETGHVSQLVRCGAKTRSGAPCKSVPVTGRRRCRMHGGADGSGAPSGPRNGNYKHGRYTKEVAATRQWLREATQLLRSFK